MIHRVIDTIRHINFHSGFEAYLENVQRSSKSGTIGVNEAKKDYQAIVRREASSLFF